MLNKTTKKYVLFTALSLLINPAFAETEQSKQEGQPAATPIKEESSQAQQNNIEGRISRSAFTSAVQNREPIDQLTILSELISEAFFFTEFKDFQGQTLTHQWSHNGKFSHSIPFTINGKRWRVFSSKTFASGAKQEGTWTVKVLDAEGTILSESSIDYIRPSTDEELVASQETAEKTVTNQESKADDEVAGDTTKTTPATADKNKEQAPTDKDNKTESPASSSNDENQDQPKSSNEEQATPEAKKESTSDETATPDASTKSDKKEAEDSNVDDVKSDSQSPEKTEAPDENKSDSDSSTQDKKTDTDEKESASEEKSEPSTSTADKPIWDNMK